MDLVCTLQLMVRSTEENLCMEESMGKCFPWCLSIAIHASHYNGNIV